MITDHPVNTALYMFMKLVHPTTGLPIESASSAITATITKYGSTSTSATVAEIDNGIYVVYGTPTTAGYWILDAEYTDITPQQNAAKAFKVGNDIEAKIDTIDTVVDSNAALLAHSTYGLSALKTLLDTKASSAAVATVDTNVDTILSAVTSGTYGLSALKTLVDAIPTTAMRGTDNAMLAANGALEATLTAIKGAGWTTQTLKAIYDAVAAISGTATAVKTQTAHNITTANDTSETEIIEITESGNYAFSAYLDLDTLEAAGEGGTVTVTLYNKIDDSNYADTPIAVSTYVVGTSTAYPSIEASMINGYCSLRIQCSDDVTDTRTIACKTIVKEV